MSDLKLVIFDVDGTLVDSQADILGAMQAAFDLAGIPVPERDTVLSIVGLSLPEAMARLAPDQHSATRARMVEAYKQRYATLRRQTGAEGSPLYPGLRDLLDRLHGRDDILLGIATGKSRRGLDALLQSHGITRLFVTTQVADTHPSKPHPAMLYAALDAAGPEAEQAVMIGDTTYDMEMAQAAGMDFIGVTWGYHDASALHRAARIVSDAAALETAIFDVLEGRA